MDTLGNASKALREKKAFTIQDGGFLEWNEGMRSGWEFGHGYGFHNDEFDNVLMRGYDANPMTLVEMLRADGVRGFLRKEAV